MKAKDKDSKLDTEGQDRRSFISLFPLGILGAIVATMGVPSKLFLDPPDTKLPSENWVGIGDVSDLSGEEPIAKTIAVESQTGWSKTIEDQTVFVLPKHENKVLSSVCPHEGCPIVWDADNRKFLCPCHDSFFSDDGKRLSGPAQNDLKQVISRVLDGELQIKI